MQPDSLQGRADPTLRVLIAVTSHVTARHFVLGFAGHLVRRGCKVTVVADSADTISALAESAGVDVRAVTMRRDPAPIRDLNSLLQMVRTVRELQPDIVLYCTPKAALLASIASTMLRVPTRVYGLWGLRLETVVGPRRRMLKAAECLTSRLSTSVVANSRSLARRYVELSLAGSTEVVVLGSGSSHGVDVERFATSASFPEADSDSLAFVSGAPALVVGFVGRLHPDKGVETLLSAIAKLRGSGHDVRAILVGSDEGVSIDERLQEESLSAGVRHVGPCSDPRPYYELMDVLVLVSLREGMPNVVLEAAAMGKPAVVSDATGAVDSVVNGVTGLVVPVEDPDALAAALWALAENSNRRARMGAAARARTEREFDQHSVWEAHADFLLGLKSGRRTRDRGVRA